MKGLYGHLQSFAAKHATQRPNEKELACELGKATRVAAEVYATLPVALLVGAT